MYDMNVQVYTSYNTDPEDPEGPCLFELQVWPLDQEIGRRLFAKLHQQVVKELEVISGQKATDLPDRSEFIQ